MLNRYSPTYEKVAPNLYCDKGPVTVIESLTGLFTISFQLWADISEAPGQQFFWTLDVKKRQS